MPTASLLTMTAESVTLTVDGPSSTVITIPLGSAVEWQSALRATDTVTDLIRLGENPVLRPLSALDPLEDVRGFDAGYLAPGRVYRRSFAQPGVYAYTLDDEEAWVVVEGALYNSYLPLVFRNRAP